MKVLTHLFAALVALASRAAAQQDDEDLMLQVKNIKEVGDGMMMRASKLELRPVEGGVSKETEAEITGAPDLSDRANKSRLLIQATFGPTRTSLAQMENVSAAEWIQKQMNPQVVEPSFHRQYYRERVNPHYDERIVGDFFASTERCSKGSRWTRHAIIGADTGKTLQVQKASLVNDTIQDPEACFERHKRWWPNGASYRNVRSALSCQAQCNVQDDCKHFTFYDHGECIFHGENARLHAAGPDAIAGSRGVCRAIDISDKMPTTDDDVYVLTINGIWRTDIVEGEFESRWTGMKNFTGVVCRVQERFGQEEVHLGHKPVLQSLIDNKQVTEHNYCHWRNWLPALPLPMVHVTPGALRVPQETLAPAGLLQVAAQAHIATAAGKSRAAAANAAVRTASRSAASKSDQGNDVDDKSDEDDDESGDNLVMPEEPEDDVRVEKTCSTLASACPDGLVKRSDADPCPADAETGACSEDDCCEEDVVDCSTWEARDNNDCGAELFVRHNAAQCKCKDCLEGDVSEDCCSVALCCVDAEGDDGGVCFTDPVGTDSFGQDHFSRTVSSERFWRGVDPSYILLKDDATEYCDLEDVIHVAGQAWRFDRRVGLVENTVDNPSFDVCAPVNFMNEHGCVLQGLTEAPEVNAENGWGVELVTNVHVKSVSGRYVTDIVNSGKAVMVDQHFVEETINHPSTGHAWGGNFTVSDHFSVRWSAILHIKEEGVYKFKTSSDDGSIVTIGGKRIVDNGGWHGMRDKEADITLTVGEHNIVVEMFEGGGGAGIVLSWQPPTASAYEVLPKDVVTVHVAQVPGFDSPMYLDTKKCSVACGSPGETRNVAQRGHQMGMWTSRRRGYDNYLDNRYATSMGSNLGKSTTWTMQALESEDQLRQRMAWALSQTFVVSAQGFNNNEYAELWLNMYDIFIRHAFGNFYDVLKEVTYNPLMGRYLTNVNSECYDCAPHWKATSTFPNENYAREIQQLFTIGLFQLTEEGEVVRDENGHDVPTYSNENILNFARVFTGLTHQAHRGNVEDRGENWIDAMAVTSSKRDIFPKPDLTGGYLGDGYPLCSESMPKKLMLAPGTTFKFVGYSLNLDGEAMTLAEDSQLAAMLQSKFQVTLEQRVSCYEPECSSDWTEFVHVSKTHALYKVSAPPCVHLYLREQQSSYQMNLRNTVCPKGFEVLTIDECQYAHKVLGIKGVHSHLYPGRHNQTRWAPGCFVNVNGRAYFNDNLEAPTQHWHYPICRAHIVVHEDGKVHPSWSLRGNDANRFQVNWDGAAVPGMHTYAVVNDQVFNDVSQLGYDNVVAKLKIGAWALPTEFCLSCVDDRVKICSQDGDGGQENICSMPLTKDTTLLVDGRFYKNMLSTATAGQCRGLASGPDAPTFNLQAHEHVVACEHGRHDSECDADWWGTCHGQVKFGHGDSWTEWKEMTGQRFRCHRGEFENQDPARGKKKICVCKGTSVEAWRLDQVRIGEQQGVANANNTAYVPCGTVAGAFRNPPSFWNQYYESMMGHYDTGGVAHDGPWYHSERGSTTVDGAERQAMAEINSLLDHLFHHANTPVFFAQRLIQRFVTSNPSKAYVKSVVEAFKSGHFHHVEGIQTERSDSRWFGTGKRGDLAATLAATLMHSEAREFIARDQDLFGSALQGKLREPMLKLMHFMRALEYRDREGEQVVLNELHEVMGQFPFQSPTVFNFYQVDFALPEPEPEPEADGAESMEGMMMASRSRPVAPEFQIFTPPYLIGYLNSMTSLVKSGVNHDCDAAKGMGIRMSYWERTRWIHECPQGRFQLPAIMDEDGLLDADGTVAELDLLLTGGRMTGVSRRKVKEALLGPVGLESKLAAAEKVAMLTPEFNTQGAANGIDGVRTAEPEPEPASDKDYKTVVVLLLSGGADTWNLMVPWEGSDLYEQYKAYRTELHLPKNEMRCMAEGGTCGTGNCNANSFGMHFSFGDFFLNELYCKEKSAAVFTNVGGLAEPLTKEEYRTRAKNRCFGLFSHADMINGAQTLKCQQMGTGAMGTGGRIADVLREDGYRVKTYSIGAGSAVWPQGFNTSREIMSVSGSEDSRYVEYPQMREAMGELTDKIYGNAYQAAYTEAFKDAVMSTEKSGSALAGVKLLTNWAGNEHLDRQLKLVSKLIAVREERGADRDFFFTSIGGWDMHMRMKDGLRSKFKGMDNAFRSFYHELKALGVWDNTVLMTTSDFARTLDVNNQAGSDHGWGGQHMMFGGSVNGGRFYNTYPEELRQDSKLDVGRGRMIPEYPWESMVVPLAEWLGVKGDSMPVVFPNIGNFNATHLNRGVDIFPPSA